MYFQLLAPSFVSANAHASRAKLYRRCSWKKGTPGRLTRGCRAARRHSRQSANGALPSQTAGGWAGRWRGATSASPPRADPSTSRSPSGRRPTSCCPPGAPPPPAPPGPSPQPCPLAPPTSSPHPIRPFCGPRKCTEVHVSEQCLVQWFMTSSQAEEMLYRIFDWTPRCETCAHESVAAPNNSSSTSLLTTAEHSRHHRLADIA